MGQPAQERVWDVEPRADEFGDVQLDRGEVIDALVEVENIGHRLGGAFVIVPRREQDPHTGLWQTTGWRFNWQSFAPGRRVKEASRPEPVNVAVGDPEVTLEAVSEEQGAAA